MDRLITVNTMLVTFNDFGEQEIIRTPFRCWARVFDLSTERRQAERREVSEIPGGVIGKSGG